VKRLLALLAGGLGLRAILKRRARPAPEPSPAVELKAKLAAAKDPEPEPESEPEGVDERRADVHARARHAIDELRENGGQ
jgi:flagellar biosynthesis/type III secretory pathway M-ring protein FliF/YscJ